MTRRSLLRCAAAGAVSLVVPGATSAEERCEPVPAGRWCDAKIATARFGAVHATQRTLVWCWAATLEMIFRWSGRLITQEQIVEQTFGRQFAVPADLLTLFNAVNRQYVDENGSPFTARARIWSADAGVEQIDNRDIIAALREERPLVVCNLSHMMVLVGVNYTEFTQGGLTINEAWVADPMLQGSVTDFMGQRLAPGFRYLLPAELIPVQQMGQLRFVADLRVVD